MTYDNIRRQYAANAKQLAGLADRAERLGRKVNGMPADFWREKARIYQSISTADDATIAAHLKAAQQSVTDRLAELRNAPDVPTYATRKTLREKTLAVGRAS
jgi:hypothetical protein